MCGRADSPSTGSSKKLERVTIWQAHRRDARAGDGGTHLSRGTRPMAMDPFDLFGTKWPTLLTIDDDPQISETLVARLNSFDVHVLCAYHGMHGFWLAMTNRPDLIITDIRMPQGGGDYVVDCLRNNSDTHDIPVIVMTGQRDTKLEARMRRLGVSDYFTKPVPFDQLAEAIRRYIPLTEREHEQRETIAG
jgi:DNA-binding NtrC family response regulator